MFDENLNDIACMQLLSNKSTLHDSSKHRVSCWYTYLWSLGHNPVVLTSESEGTAVVTAEVIGIGHV